jgi:hypothetical protein
MGCSWGWIVVACIPFGITSLHFLPLPTIEIIDHLEEGVQIMILIVGTLITYKFFTLEDSDFKKFMGHFRKKSRRNDITIEDDVEAAAAILGDYTNI